MGQIQNLLGGCRHVYFSWSLLAISQDHQTKVRSMGEPEAEVSYGRTALGATKPLSVVFYA